MPDFSTLALFAAASLVLTATPGPDMLLIASRSVSQGQGAGFLTYAGIASAPIAMRLPPPSDCRS